MSSFIGHALTAGAIFLARKKPKQECTPKGLLWLGCLGLAALAPDLDYFLPMFQKSNHGGVRISNSFAFALLIPTLVSIIMLIMRVGKRTFLLRFSQITIAGVSHVILDYLVGVHPSPLFWPLSNATYAAPIGILPSAGALSLTNFYFYRNLAIELGVLMPIYISIWLTIWHRPSRSQRRWSIILALALVSITCIAIAISLSR